MIRLGQISTHKPHALQESLLIAIGCFIMMSFLGYLSAKKGREKEKGTPVLKKFV
jgi:hypothetical protein